LFVPPYCRCHDDGSFRFTVIAKRPCCCLFACDNFRCGLAVTSRFLWLAPHTNEILDVDTSKVTTTEDTQPSKSSAPDVI